jgi:hypothetical protein
VDLLKLVQRYMFANSADRYLSRLIMIVLAKSQLQNYKWEALLETKTITLDILGVFMQLPTSIL